MSSSVASSQWGVRRRRFVGEERWRVQELHVSLDCGLVEVMGLGLIICGEEDVVRSVHTLIAGVVQVYHRLHVFEEEEKGAGGRARSRKERSRRRDRTHVDDHVDEVNGANFLSLSPGACVRKWMTRLLEKVCTVLNGCGQWWAHRAVPRKHGCRHWRPCSGVWRKLTCCHWRSRCALSPNRTLFWFFTSCPNSHLVVML